MSRAGQRRTASPAGSTRGAGPGRSFFGRPCAARATSGELKGSSAPSASRTQIALIVGVVVIVSLVFGAAGASAAEPTVTLDPTPAVGYTTAHVSGTVDPADNEVFPFFRYAHDPEAEGWTGLGPLYETFVPISGAGPHNVSDDFSGLTPGTEYKFRLGAEVIGSGEFFESEPPFPSFTTKAVATPTATIDPILTHTDSTAHFSGTVQTNAPIGPLDPEAEAVFKAEWSFSCSPECPGLIGGVVEAGEASKVVEADATGLEPNTTYVVTLTATNLGGPGTDTKSFTTTALPPTVKTAPGTSDGKAGYFLQGIVDPHNSAITGCEFRYGPTAAYGQSIPCDVDPGAVNRAVEVNAHLTGLDSGSEYHFQLVATNGAESGQSGDSTFVPTFVGPPLGCANEVLRAENNSLALPECRAYEQVSPVEKNGFGAVPFGAYYTEDEGLGYSSFAGNIANSGPGAIGNIYATFRSEDGWETTPDLNPPSGSIYAGPDALSAPSEEFNLTGDLRSGLYFASKAGESAGIADLYLRESGGSFTLIGRGSALPPDPPGHSVFRGQGLYPFFLGTSADLSHLVFADAETSGPWGPGLWEFVGTGNDRPRLVSVDNSGQDCGGLSSVTLAHKNNAISADGRVIFFMPSGCGGGVWARVDGTTSYDASASQCTRIDCNAPSQATFEGASLDGSRVYFLTAQQLVNGDTDETTDLYSYDLPTAADPHPSSPLAEVSGASTGADVQGVVRVSDDGSRVYFVAKGVLAANPDALGEAAAPGDDNLYVWERDAAHPAGQTTFVARLSPADASVLWGEEGGPGRMAQTTADGRYLVFSTFSPLLATDTDSAEDVYRYDAETGQMTRISIATSGVGGNEEGLDATISSVGYGAPWAGHRSRTSLSNNGEDIIFATREALSPADTNASPDLYLWRAGQVSLISGGRGEGIVGSGRYGIDGSGRNIYFATAEPLTPGDSDSVADVYDARILGGFSASQVQTPCSGEACRAASSTPPAASAAATDHSGTGGNVAPKRCPKGKAARKGHCVQPKRCPKGRAAGGGQCVKKQPKGKSKQSGQQQRADNNRRAGR